MERAVVLAMLVGLAACGGSQEPRTARTVLEEFTSQHPNAPVVVPIRWSEEWESFEPDMWQEADGRVTEVHFRILPVDSGLPGAIGICIAPPDLEGRPCDLGEGIQVRTVDGVDTVVYSFGEERPREEWSDVELTTRWRSVDWLDDVSGGCCE